MSSSGLNQNFEHGMNSSGCVRMPSFKSIGSKSISNANFSGSANQKFTMRSSVIPMAMKSSNEQLQSRIEEQLFMAIQNAEACRKGSKEAAHAWEIVEELDQTLSHTKGSEIKSKDTEAVTQEVRQYLKSHPENYDAYKKSHTPTVNGDLPGEYMEVYGFSDYVDLEIELQDYDK